MLLLCGLIVTGGLLKELNSVNAAPESYVLYYAANGDSYIRLSSDLKASPKAVTTPLRTLISDGIWSVGASQFAEIRDTSVYTAVDDWAQATIFCDFPDQNIVILGDFAPDGKQIVVITGKQTDSTQVTALVVCLADGSKQTVLGPSDMWKDFLPGQVQFSPNGQFIALDAKPAGVYASSNLYLFPTNCLKRATTATSTIPGNCQPTEVQIIDTSGPRPIISAPQGDFEEPWQKPVWSVDSQQLAFLCGEQVCTIHRDGSHFRRLPINNNDDNKTDLAQLSWSPDNRYLAYVSQQHVHVFDLLTNAELILTPAPGTVSEDIPRWFTTTQETALKIQVSKP